MYLKSSFQTVSNYPASPTNDTLLALRKETSCEQSEGMGSLKAPVWIEQETKFIIEELV
jgi:hypothetical protein